MGGGLSVAEPVTGTQTLKAIRKVCVHRRVVWAGGARGLERLAVSGDAEVSGAARTRVCTVAHP